MSDDLSHLEQWERGALQVILLTGRREPDQSFVYKGRAYYRAATARIVWEACP